MPNAQSERTVRELRPLPVNSGQMISLSSVRRDDLARMEFEFISSIVTGHVSMAERLVTQAP